MSSQCHQLIRHDLQEFTIRPTQKLSECWNKQDRHHLARLFIVERKHFSKTSGPNIQKYI